MCHYELVDTQLIANGNKKQRPCRTHHSFSFDSIGYFMSNSLSLVHLADAQRKFTEMKSLFDFSSLFLRPICLMLGCCCFVSSFVVIIFLDAGSTVVVCMRPLFIPKCRFLDVSADAALALGVQTIVTSGPSIKRF